MKVFNAISDNFFKTKDNSSKEHLEINEYRNDLKSKCNQYLRNEDDILVFECLEKALPYVITILEEESFLRDYEFEQLSETMFRIRLRGIDL